MIDKEILTHKRVISNFEFTSSMLFIPVKEVNKLLIGILEILHTIKLKILAIIPKIIFSKRKIFFT